VAQWGVDDMSKYCRSDKCQDCIVRELRQIGARVKIVSQFKLGFDIIVGIYGVVGLFELKNTKKDKLTEPETIFALEWNGYVHTVTTTQEILTIMAHCPFTEQKK
jgi:hypothetical protein